MNNKEVAHLWANRSRPSAKGSHFYFEGDTIYSYGPHFPIARLIKHPTGGEDVVLFNPARYSLTTTRHQSLVLSATLHLPRVSVVNVRYEVATAADLVRLAAEWDASQEAEKVATAARRRRQAKERRERTKAVNESRANFPAELTAWRAGGPLPSAVRWSLISGTWLRLIDGGRYIGTSKGAKVPALVARKAWPLLSAAVAKEEANPSPSAWVPFWELPEFNWGDYRGLSLRRVALGSPVELVIGCHCIPWAEVEIMAEALGLTGAKEVSA